MFGFGEEDEEYEQQPRKSLFSRIGDFLLKGVMILAIVALAIVTIVTINDTARNKLNELTKDKDGKGGWGDAIRGGMGAAQEKAGGMLGAVKETVTKAFQSTGDTIVAAKDQAVNTVNTAENVALAGAGALVAKKLYNKYGNHAQGTVGENGEFNPLSKKENKAVKEAEALKAKQEALKAQREAMLEKSREARAKFKNAEAELKKANAVKESAKAEIEKMTLKEKISNIPETGKAAMALKSATEAEQTAEQSLKKSEQALKKTQKELKTLRNEINGISAAIAKAEKIIPPGVITRGEFNARQTPSATANGASSTSQTTAQTATKPEAPKTAPQPPPSKEVVTKPSGQVTVMKGKEVIADITDKQAGGTAAPHAPNTNLWNKLKGVGRSFRMLGRGVFAPVAVAGIAIEGGAEAMASLENGNNKEAGLTTLKTAAQATVFATAPEAFMAVEGLKALASTDAVTGGARAFSKYKLSDLNNEQRAEIEAWKKEAEERGLDISTLKVREFLEKQWNSAPNTPNTLITSKEQTQSPVKGN
ncbi:MAG: hypothetical protein AABY33_00055 [Pseudomonadota bacterium]